MPTLDQLFYTLDHLPWPIAVLSVLVGATGAMWTYFAMVERGYLDT